jgi:hypothetical protein
MKKEMLIYMFFVTPVAFSSIGFNGVSDGYNSCIKTMQTIAKSIEKLKNQIMPLTEDKTNSEETLRQIKKTKKNCMKKINTWQDSDAYFFSSFLELQEGSESNNKIWHQEEMKNVRNSVLSLCQNYYSFNENLKNYFQKSEEEKYTLFRDITIFYEVAKCALSNISRDIRETSDQQETSLKQTTTKCRRQKRRNLRK